MKKSGWKKTCRGSPELTWSIRKSFSEKVTFEGSSEGGGRVNRLGCGGENLAEDADRREKHVSGTGKGAQCDRGIGKTARRTMCSWREVSLRLGDAESLHILGCERGTPCWPGPSFVLTGSFLQREPFYSPPPGCPH